MLKRLILAASVVCSLPGQDLNYQILDGWAVVEGDILLGKVAEIAQTAPETSSKSAVRHAIGRTSGRARWPEGVVPYVVSEEIPNPKRILDAVEHWNQNTPVRLVERTTETNYVKFLRSSSASTC